MFVVPAAAGPVATGPVDQAVQHYSKARLIAAVPAKLGARAASLVSCASATVVALSAEHRPSAVCLAFAAVAAELSSEIAPAEA